jgi:hypothetical protein
MLAPTERGHDGRVFFDAKRRYTRSLKGECASQAPPGMSYAHVIFFSQIQNCS